MPRTLLLLVFLPLAALAAKSPPKLQARFDVSFENTHSSVEVSPQRFRYDGDQEHEEFEIRACNRGLVEMFIDQYKHLQKTEPVIPESLLGPNTIVLKEGKKETKVPRASQFGLWLRQLPSKSQTLRLSAEAKCKSKT